MADEEDFMDDDDIVMVDSDDDDDDDDLSSIAMVNSEGDECETVYQPSRERLESSSQSEFFDCLSCNSWSPGNVGGGSERCSAQYIDGQCVYEDGTPAFVQQGDCENDLPPHYLAACGGRRKNAMKMWKASRKWRQEDDVWRIHQKPNRWFPKIKKAYPHFVHGYTKDGYPVIYEQPGRMFLKTLFREGCEVSDMTKWYIFFMEYLSNYICTRPEIRSRRGLDTTNSLLNSSSWGFVIVMDMEGVGPSILSSDVVSYLKQAGGINTAHYPLSVKGTFMVKAGPVIARLWSGLRVAVPKTAHLDILNAKKYRSALLEYIDDDQIPPEYGGSSPYSLGQHPYEVELMDLIRSTEDNIVSIDQRQAPVPVLTPISSSLETSTSLDSSDSGTNNLASSNGSPYMVVPGEDCSVSAQSLPPV